MAEGAPPQRGGAGFRGFDAQQPPARPNRAPAATAATIARNASMGSKAGGPMLEAPEPFARISGHADPAEAKKAGHSLRRHFEEAPRHFDAEGALVDEDGRPYGARPVAEQKKLPGAATAGQETHHHYADEKVAGREGIRDYRLMGGMGFFEERPICLPHEAKMGTRIVHENSATRGDCPLPKPKDRRWTTQGLGLPGRGGGKNAPPSGLPHDARLGRGRPDLDAKLRYPANPPGQTGGKPRSCSPRSPRRRNVGSPISPGRGGGGEDLRSGGVWADADGMHASLDPGFPGRLVADYHGSRLEETVQDLERPLMATEVRCDEGVRGRAWAPEVGQGGDAGRRAPGPSSKLLTQGFSAGSVPADREEAARNCKNAVRRYLERELKAEVMDEERWHALQAEPEGLRGVWKLYGVAVGSLETVSVAGDGAPALARKMLHLPNPQLRNNFGVVRRRSEYQAAPPSHAHFGRRPLEGRTDGAEWRQKVAAVRY